MINSIAAWVLPPGLLLLLAAWGLQRMRRRPRSGITLTSLSLAALWALSMPWVARALLNSIEPQAADPRLAPAAAAIVVLGAGKYHAAPEYGADTVGEGSLARVRYAAFLHRHTGKPILVSGGSPEGAALSEAQVMKAVLENEFRTPVQWTEAASNNTLENARASRALLEPLGINRIYLVTHAWHMPRAQRVFAQAGFDVVPAPTQYATHFRTTLLDFMPRAHALRDSSHFVHEIIGAVWYRVKSVFV